MLRAVLLASALALHGAASAKNLNGFELSQNAASIPIEEIVGGGPPRDGIPALVGPRLWSEAESSWSDEALVIGVALGGEARAYPIDILVYHELVNDELGGQRILVSYCPLCGSAIVFSREINDESRIFKVSGLLYKSDLLMYDVETQSLWSQISASAVTGPALGARLKILRSAQLTWGEWRERHPDSTVLSRDTGHGRPYGRQPYGGYADSRDLMFPVPRDRRYHPKMPTLGLRTPSGRARGYPAQEIMNAGGRIEDEFSGYRVSVAYRPRTRSFEVEAPAPLEVLQSFWFAWAAFHPDGEVFVDSSAGQGRSPLARGASWR